MSSILEKREEIRNEEITLKKKVYQARIGKTYNRGRVHALRDVGYAIPEIAKALELQESTVRVILNEGM